MTFKLNHKSRGFLFTISIILFASTLLFFAQTYANNNSVNEKQIILSSKAVFVPNLIDDVSYDLLRVFGLSIYADGNGVLEFNGSVSGSLNYSSIISSYSDFISNKVFPSNAWVESTDLTSLSDGAAEINTGANYVFRNNYSAKSVVFAPKNGYGELSSIDLNIRAGKDLNYYLWTAGPVIGSSSVNFNFSGDSNAFLVSELLDLNSASSIVLVFSDDSNMLVTFGTVSTGEDAGVEIFTNSTEKIDYSLRVKLLEKIMPVEWNSWIKISDARFDSNSLIAIYR